MAVTILWLSILDCQLNPKMAIGQKTADRTEYQSGSEMQGILDRPRRWEGPLVFFFWDRCVHLLSSPLDIADPQIFATAMSSIAAITEVL